MSLKQCNFTAIIELYIDEYLLHTIEKQNKHVETITHGTKHHRKSGGKSMP